MSRERAQHNVDRLTASFGHYLEVFEIRCPFNEKQLRWHLDTLGMRFRLGTPSAAIADEQFLRRLWYTLDAWDMNAHGTKLQDMPTFRASLAKASTQLDGLQGLRIDAPNLDIQEVRERVWSILEGLTLGRQASPLVVGSKALHHILPNLVVPVDNAYTNVFFDCKTQFYSRPRAVWQYMFRAFAEIARTVDPGTYVGQGWNSSRSKVIDNAIVGFVKEELS